MKKTLMTVFLTSALAIGATAAVAQSYGQRYDNGPAGPVYAAPDVGPYGAGPNIYGGENRDTAYGAGGTAGTHPTGANVGPGRAQMDHSTGN